MCCSFPDDLVEEVRAALGERVVAAGRVDRNALGQPVDVRLQSLYVLRDDGAPSVDDLVGIAPGLTGGVDSVEYVAAQRRRGA